MSSTVNRFVVKPLKNPELQTQAFWGSGGTQNKKKFCRRFQTLTVNGHVDGKLHDKPPFLKLKNKFVIQDYT